MCPNRKGPERGEPCRDRKSTGAQKQTNKAQAAVIKSSLVLVMHRNAAERQAALSFLTDRGQSLEPVWTPALCNSGRLPRSPLCFHLSWHVQGDECFASILWSGKGRGRRAPRPLATGLGALSLALGRAANVRYQRAV